MGAGAASLMSWNGLFSMPAFAAEAKKQQKHCILLWLCGAPSQFETWDPKPDSIYGGPFKSIPTKIPGRPFRRADAAAARRIADKLAIVRSMKTKQGEHFQAINLLQRGAEPREPFVRPTLGSVLAQQLGHLDSPIPNFILLDPCPEGNEFKEFKAGNWAGWLGAQYGPVRAGRRVQAGGREPAGGHDHAGLRTARSAAPLPHPQIRERPRQRRSRLRKRRLLARQGADELRRPVRPEQGEARKTASGTAPAPSGCTPCWRAIWSRTARPS